jgi:nitrous oxide reductase accessory protein NosL
MSAPRRSAGFFALMLSVSLVTGCDRMQSWLHPEQCVLSGRPIHAGMGVRIRIDDEPPSRACCLRCTIVAARQMEKTIHVLSVTDYVSHDQIPPRDALYVVGSSVTPCAGSPVEVPANRRESAQVSWDRCLPSIIAFETRTDAERFQRDSGGRIQTFAELTEGTTVTAPREGEA